jgi:hypothetical protein
MDAEEKAAFLKTKAGKLWNKHQGEWSPEDCRLILKGEIQVGMLTSEVRAAWGKPNHVNTSMYASGTREQWVYSDTSYVYFEDGVMTSLHQQRR